MTLVFNLKDPARPRECVRVDRTTIWGNPYTIHARQSRAEVIRLYRIWLWSHFNDPCTGDEITLEGLAALADRPLACWCAPLPCHADVLVAAARWARAKLAALPDGAA